MASVRPYLYSPLDNSKEIRLVILAPSRSFRAKIKCRLFHQSLQNIDRPFDALSYVWGDASSRRLVSLNENEFSVTANLHTALRHLRYANDQRILWIDAICINQDDIPERNQQVTKMREIYQRATKVIVWLGPASKNSDLAISFLAEASTRKHEIEDWLPTAVKAPNVSLFKSWKAYCEIGSRDYWTRVWPIQEIVSGSSVIVRCGFRCIRWPDFSFLFHSVATFPALTDPGERVIEVLGNKLDNIHKSTKASDELDCILLLPEIMKSSRGPAAIEQQKRSRDELDPPLELILAFYRNLISTDPRDKVFGIVGMTGQYSDQRALKIDYNWSLRQTYIEAVRCMIARSRYLDWRPLNFICDSHPHFSDGTLPSWVPDWRAKSGTDMVMNVPISLYKASGNWSLNSKIEIGDVALIVQGLEIATVDHLGAVPVPYPKLPLASQILDMRVAVEATAADYAIGAAIATNFQLAMSKWEHVPLSQRAFNIRRKQFCRTLLCDHGPPTEYISHLRLSEEALEGFCPLIESLVRHKQWRQLFTGTKATPSTQLLGVARGYLEHYRFCVSSVGTYLIAPPTVCKGDVVCVLQGCDIPVLLRRQSEKHYVFVGRCYAEGIMYGEAAEHIADGTYKVETFRIH